MNDVRWTGGGRMFVTLRVDIKGNHVTNLHMDIAMHIQNSAHEAQISDFVKYTHCYNDTSYSTHKLL